MTLTKVNIEELAKKLRGKRGVQSLRDAAEEATVSFSTFSRVEKGHIPDLENYTKLCSWLHLPVDTFTDPIAEPKANEDKIYMHLRANTTLPAEVSESLIVMIKAALSQHSKSKKVSRTHGQ